MIYLDHETGRLTSDEDLAIAMNGTRVVTIEVVTAATALIFEGVLEPLHLAEVA